MMIFLHSNLSNAPQAVLQESTGNGLVMNDLNVMNDLKGVLWSRMKAARHGDGDDSLLASSDQEDVEMGNSGSLSVRPTLSPRASRDTIRTSGNEPHL